MEFSFFYQENERIEAKILILYNGIGCMDLMSCYISFKVFTQVII
jgi:hypothetical protein